MIKDAFACVIDASIGVKAVVEEPDSAYVEAFCPIWQRIH